MLDSRNVLLAALLPLLVLPIAFVYAWLTTFAPAIGWGTLFFVGVYGYAVGSIANLLNWRSRDPSIGLTIALILLGVLFGIYFNWVFYFFTLLNGVDGFSWNHLVLSPMALWEGAWRFSEMGLKLVDGDPVAPETLQLSWALEALAQGLIIGGVIVHGYRRRLHGLAVAARIRGSSGAAQAD